MYAGNRNAFTMIELLMVIMIVAILGAAALPQFLDFRHEARVSAMRQGLTILRSSIRMHQTLIRLRCDQSYTTTIPNTALNANDLGALCTVTQISGTDRRFIDSEVILNEGTPYESVMPVNALNEKNYVDSNNCVAQNKCTCPPGAEAAMAGWYINPQNEIWPNDPVHCAD